MSDYKLKSIPRKDFNFEGLNEQCLGSFKSFPKQRTKLSFQMPRPAPKIKRCVESQKNIRTIDPYIRDLSSHISFSKFAPAVVYHNINKFLTLTRPEKPVFDPIFPSSSYYPKYSTLKQNRPHTSRVRIKKTLEEPLKEIIAKNEKDLPIQEIKEKRLEKLSIYIKAPEFDYTESVDDFLK